MCACKGTSTSRQVSAVKQIVKKPANTYSSGRKTSGGKKTRQIIFQRHM
jgi:hypothetical protein